MSDIPEHLKEVAERVHDGHEEKHTLRDLLGWFDQQRRGSVVNRRIKSALADQELRTEPDFKSVYIDDELEFISATSNEEKRDKETDSSESPEYVGHDVKRDGSTYQVRRFLTEEKMKRGLEYIERDKKVSEAVTTMLVNDYSQLPVMQNEHSLKGLVSWQTIGKAFGLGKEPECVRDCMEMEKEVSVVEDTDSIFKLIEYVRTKEVALVRDDGEFVTIFTAADLGDLYKDMSEPFMYLGEIEDSIRAILELGKFTVNELEEYRGPDDDKEIKRMDDLTFGSYIRIAQNPDNWDRIGLSVDRAIFTDKLDEVREIRNAVMHFDPDGLTPEQVEQLRLFSEFLRDLR